MARDGSGNYTLPVGNPVTTGTTITSTWANTTLSDLATAMTGSVAADGQTGMSGDLAMGGHKVSGAGDGTAATDLATVGQVPKIIKPIVSVYKPSMQLIPPAAHTKIGSFTEAEVNYGTWWNTSNDKFTPTIAGWYLVTAQLFFNVLQPNGANCFIWTSLHRNGSSTACEVKRGTAVNVGTTMAAFGSVLAGIVHLNGTSDYLELYGAIDAGTGYVSVGTDPPDDAFAYTYFQAMLIGA